MSSTIPFSRELVQRVLSQINIAVPGRASIREIVNLANHLEAETGIRFIRMEMGVPGLPAAEIGIEAEIIALRNGVASVYPPIEGIPALKNETSRFIKLFLDVDLKPEGCIPVCGSMQGAYICFATINRTDPEKEGTLFIDPGFPVHKQQCQVLGHRSFSFDIYNYRGAKLRDKLESFLSTGKVSSILYSNPNNPSWVCLNEEELSIIGDLANKYDIIVMEDLAYFGMDFRRDISEPGVPPFQPTVAKYTDNYILFISTSKVFSYAGQRIGIMAVSDKLFHRKYPHLRRYYSSDELGHTMTYGTLYPISAGTGHSAQVAAAEIFRAANDGTHNFFREVQEYARRANRMKEIFTRNGFKIVYDMDVDEPIADGFYFTVSYPGLSGEKLLEELLYYGISAITLDITGSTRTEGLRACVSLAGPEMYGMLEDRLKLFRDNHPNG